MSVFTVEKRVQRLQVGDTFELITGLAEDGVVWAPMGDTGAATMGVQGDVMLEVMAMNAYTITVNLLAASTSIRTLLDLRDTVGFFPVKFQLGGADIQGVAAVQNEGETSGAAGAKVRVITLACARTVGRLNGIGTNS